MISVCMATYNGEKFLEKQLESILTQITEYDEVIISDDGSYDQTIDIIHNYMKKYKNIVLVEGPHKGVIKNFENAIKNSKGDIIFLSDQDDIWVEGKVKRVLTEFENPKKLVVLHDAFIVDQNEKIISESFFYHRGSKPGVIKNLVKNSYLGCCMAFKQSLVEKCIPFPEKIEMHDWWIGMLGEIIGEVSFISEKLLLYRRHGNNVSSFHHHPLKKMIFNRIYLVRQLSIRLKKVEKRC